jgi:hypothetical protein
MHRVAHDREFLTQTLAKTVKVDDFTARLFKIYETVWDEGLTQVGTLMAHGSRFWRFSSTCVMASKYRYRQ